MTVVASNYARKANDLYQTEPWATRVLAYDTAPDELKPTILTLALVEQKASELRRKAKGKH